MNTITRLLFLPLLLLGLLSCQEERVANAPATSSVALSARIVSANGTAIPVSDSIHFQVSISGRALMIDTVVAWSRHELDLGSANPGDSIHWQAIAWKDSAGQRVVVWASARLGARVSSSGSTTAFSLETPVLAGIFPAPSLKLDSAVRLAAGSITIPVADTAFRLSFQVSPGVSRVWINDTLATIPSGVVAWTIRAAPGTQVTISIRLQDTLGAITRATYRLDRPALPVVDSTIQVSFESPTLDQVLPSTRDSFTVRVRTNAILVVDSVVVSLNGARKAKIEGASTIWSVRLDGLPVGRDTIEAVAYAASGRKTGRRSVTITRLAPGQVDRSLHLAILEPDTTALPSRQDTVVVRVKTWSVQPVDSVILGTGTRLVIAKTILDSTWWTTTVRDIPAGTTTLTVSAFAGDSVKTLSTAVVRLSPVMVDSSVSVSFVSPSRDTTLAVGAQSLTVEVRSVSSVPVEKVLLSGVEMSRSTGDSTLWISTVTGLVPGSKTLDAIAILRGGKPSAPATRTLSIPADSSLSVQLVRPDADVSLPFAQDTLSVETKATSGLVVDSVVLFLDGTRIDSARRASWVVVLRSLSNLPVGSHMLKVRAFAPGGRRAEDSINIVRLAQGIVDSSIGLTILSPVDPTLPHARDSIAVRVLTTSKLPVDSVRLGARSMRRESTSSDSTWWVDTARGLPVGSTTIAIVAFGSKGAKTTSRSLVANRRDIVGVPIFTPPAGSYPSARWIKLSDSASGVSYLASTDAKTWIPYRDSILVDVPETLWVKAFAAGRDTASATAIYTITATAKPTFSPAGGIYKTAQTVSLASSTPGSILEYSLDGATWVTYTTQLSVSTTTRIRARARRAGMTTTQDSALYTIAPKPAAPTFDPAGGTFTSTQMVTIQCATVGAILQWSTDSMVWTTDSTATISASKVLFARAYIAGSDTSHAKASYTILNTLEAPSFGVVSGTYTQSQSVGISAPSGATILYSTDSVIWRVYTGPLSISVSDTIFAYDSAAGMANSAVSVLRMVLQVPTPTLSRGTGTYATTQSVSLSDSLVGATIRYRFGSGGSWIVYSGSISVASNDTLFAYASATGRIDSRIVSAIYRIRCPAPTFLTPSGTYTSTFTATATGSTACPDVSYAWGASTIWSAASGHSVTTSGTLRVKVSGARMEDAIDSVNYVLKVARPSVEFRHGRVVDTVSLSVATASAALWWSHDTAAGWNSYTGRFVVDSTRPLHVQARRAGWSSTGLDTVVVPPRSGTIVDSRDSKTYRWVKIRSRIWMAENMNYASPRSLCYDLLESNCANFGRLYSWAEAMGLDSVYDVSFWSGSEDRQGVCPTGWHVPTIDDWHDLLSIDSARSSTLLKTTTGWPEGFNGTDTYGFGAKAAGAYIPAHLNDGTPRFLTRDTLTYFWSSSQHPTADAATMYQMGVFWYGVDRGLGSKEPFRSLRCVENLP